MTLAVCYQCGETKIGAWSMCHVCGVEPKGDDDMALSLALSDHYQTEEALADISSNIKTGTWRPVLGEEERAELVGLLKEINGKDRPPSRRDFKVHCLIIAAIVVGTALVVGLICLISTVMH